MVLLQIDRDKEEWVEITKEEKNLLPQETQDQDVIYVDRLKKKKLDFGKAQQKANSDFTMIYDGGEGSGKSSDAYTDMRYITNDKFDPKKHMVGADFDDAIDKIEAVEDGLGLVFDEGQPLLASNDHMKRESKELHKAFSIMRQKRLAIIIILPSIFRLNTYFAIDRSRFLIHHYVKDGERGYFSYYGGRRKDNLVRMGKKTHDHGVVQPSFRGRFTKCLPLENPEYNKFKRETLMTALRNAKTPKNKPKSEHELKKQIIKDFVIKNPDKTSKELGSFLDVTERRIQQIRKEHTDGGISLE